MAIRRRQRNHRHVNQIWIVESNKLKYVMRKREKRAFNEMLRGWMRVPKESVIKYCSFLTCSQNESKRPTKASTTWSSTFTVGKLLKTETSFVNVWQHFVRLSRLTHCTSRWSIVRERFNVSAPQHDRRRGNFLIKKQNGNVLKWKVFKPLTKQLKIAWNRYISYISMVMDSQHGYPSGE